MTTPIRNRLNLAVKVLVIGAAIVMLSAPLFIGFVSGPEYLGQSQQTVRLAFEVASVKPDQTGGNTSSDVRQSMMLQYLPGGRFSVRGVSIPVLISEAYRVAPGPSRRMTFGPEFLKSLDQRMMSETYDIEAVAEKGAIPANASTKVQREKIRLMLQSLLADRFKVRISRDTKEVPVYAITIGPNGPKLQKSAMDEAQCTALSADKPEMSRFFLALDPNLCHMFDGGEGRPLRGQAITMSDLARALELFADRPVVDQTGLNGIYKIDVPAFQPLRPAPPPPAGTEPTTEPWAFPDPARPTLADVLKDLGLKLESAKAPVEMLVVEHFERPTQN